MSAKERNRQAQRAYRERQKVSTSLVLSLIGVIWDCLGHPRTPVMLLPEHSVGPPCRNRRRQRYKSHCIR